MTRPGIDPILKALLDEIPLEFTIDDGVEVARERFRAMKPPAEMLPDMRIEERTVGYGDLDDIPVRIYWPPIDSHHDLPVVVFYHGGGWAIGDLDTHDHVARAPRVWTMPGLRCNGLVSTPRNSAVTPLGSPSPEIPPVATCLR